MEAGGDGPGCEELLLLCVMGRPRAVMLVLCLAPKVEKKRGGLFRSSRQPARTPAAVLVNFESSDFVIARAWWEEKDIRLHEQNWES